MEIDAFIKFVILIFAISLFTVGAYLFFQKQTTAGFGAMTFVFLFVVVLTISKYKHIDGFGFKAEMWDEKQVEAARLIDRLELLSKETSQQLSVLTSRMGLWNSALSNPEMADLLERTRKILATTGTTDAEKQNILAPLNWRINLNYVAAARELTTNALGTQRESVAKNLQTASGDEAAAMRERIKKLDDALTRFRADTNFTNYVENKSIQIWIGMAREIEGLDNKDQLLTELQGIQTDMQFFNANGTLRRRIDWSYVHK